MSEQKRIARFTGRIEFIACKDDILELRLPCMGRLRQQAHPRDALGKKANHHVLWHLLQLHAPAH